MLPGLALALTLAVTPQATDTAEIGVLPLVGTLAVDSEVRDSLRRVDVTRSGQHVRVWRFRGPPGAAVTIDLISTDFDALLFVTAPGFTPVTDDDGGGACHARVTFTPAAGATYRVAVTSLAGGAVGAYTLRASTTPPPPAAGPCTSGLLAERFPQGAVDAATPAGRLTVGDTALGRLGGARRIGGSPAEVYVLDARAGDVLTIDLRASAFDAYVGVMGPGLPAVLTDDDGGGLCDARLTVTFPVTGTYRVIASSFDDGASGPFHLVATRRPGALAAGTCADAQRASPATIRRLPVVADLAPGDSISGQLAAGQPTLDNGGYAQAYRLRGRTGDRFHLVLRSDAFDAVLIMSGLDLLRSDDDGAGGTDACLDVTLPDDGAYRVVATAYGVEEGAYRLTARRIRADAAHPCTLSDDAAGWHAVTLAGDLAVGEEVQGRLDTNAGRAPDDQLALAWTIQGTRGMSVTFDLMSSTFDAALIVVGPGVAGIMWDDDSGGACNARVTMNFPETGTYRVVATTMAGGRGPFVLRATQAPGPINPSACLPGG